VSRRQLLHPDLPHAFEDGEVSVAADTRDGWPYVSKVFPTRTPFIRTGITHIEAPSLHKTSARYDFDGIVAMIEKL
jgi:hypothetical protein